MASSLYDSGKAAILGSTVNWTSDNISAQLINSTTYVANLTTHANFSDITAGGRIGSSVALANKTATGGAADADDVTFSSVTGSNVHGVVLYKNTGTEASSTLIAYIDGFTPIIPNGSNIILAWSNGTNKIFKL